MCLSAERSGLRFRARASRKSRIVRATSLAGFDPPGLGAMGESGALGVEASGSSGALAGATSEVFVTFARIVL